MLYIDRYNLFINKVNKISKEQGIKVLLKNLYTYQKKFFSVNQNSIFQEDHSKNFVNFSGKGDFYFF